MLNDCFLFYVMCVGLFHIGFGNSATWDEECTNDGPLGMISGEIANWQIMSSSTYPASWTKNCEEFNARLYLKNRLSWCAKFKSSSEWLQVDLGVAAQVTGVMTQGRGDGSEWVTSFMLSYSLDGVHYSFVTDSYGNQKIFEGNSDAYTVKHNYLDDPVKARYIKFHTYTWHTHPSMRVEILGCQPCKKVLGLPPYTRLSATSSRGARAHKTCTEEYGHIFSNKAWCARRQNTKQWLQLDIGPPTLITGLITKGRGDRKHNHWVTSYKISYSNDSHVWFFYKDASYMDPRRNAGLYSWQNPSASGSRDMDLIFDGNADKNTEKVHFLPSPFVSRFVRFHPLRWNGRIAMRAGLMGCPHKGDCGTGFFKINNRSTCVANLAYKKTAWLNMNGMRHWKRHLPQHPPQQQMLSVEEAERAVDGNIDGGLRRCTVLKYQWPYADVPTWYVDLRDRTLVSGVVIYTGQKEGAKNDPNQVKPNYLTNLDRLAVYVDNEPRRQKSALINSPNMCGYVTRLNNALLRPRIHIPCSQPIKGRYVYIEANGVSSGWTKEFTAVLCEVMVY